MGGSRTALGGLSGECPAHQNVPGRKSDVQECQWLLKLHAFGLLNHSFQPSDEIRVARTLWRHRGDLVAEAGSAVQRMQKVLTEMNVQLSNALSDLSGVSGRNITPWSCRE
jgi:transposase